MQLNPELVDPLEALSCLTRLYQAVSVCLLEKESESTFLGLWRRVLSHNQGFWAKMSTQWPEPLSNPNQAIPVHRPEC